MGAALSRWRNREGMRVVFGRETRVHVSRKSRPSIFVIGRGEGSVVFRQMRSDPGHDDKIDREQKKKREGKKEGKQESGAEKEQRRSREEKRNDFFWGDGVISNRAQVILSNRMPCVPMMASVSYITSNHCLRGYLPRLHPILLFLS